MTEPINWPATIHAIRRGFRWSYRIIGEKVGLCGAEIAKMARGDANYEPRYTQGRKLLELAEKAKEL